MISCRKATRSQALHPLSLEVVRASYFFVMEWISAMYPPGNLTTTASRSPVLYGGTSTSAPAALALVSVCANFDARCLRIIRRDGSVGESKKAAHEGIRSVWRNIDAIFRDSLGRGIGRRSGVPIQLCVDATGPLNKRVSTDRVVEGSDEHVCARGLGRANRLVHVRDQIACPLQPKRIRDRRLESENGYRSRRRQDQLRHRAALGRGYCEDSLLGRCAAKCRNQARHEAIEIFRSHIDMRRVVLRPYSHAYGFGCLRTLGESADVERSNRETERQN